MIAAIFEQMTLHSMHSDPDKPVNDIYNETGQFMGSLPCKSVTDRCVPKCSRAQKHEFHKQM
jgi:hypothetical protein